MGFNKLQNIQLSGIKNGIVTLTSDASFTNPNDYSVTIKSIECDLYIDGNKVSELHQNMATKMPSKAEFTLPIEVEIPAEELKKNLANILLGVLKQKKTLIKLEGVLKVDLAGITLPVPFTHEEEKGLNF